MSMVWNISLGHLELAVWLCSLPAPAHLLISWIRETGKSPWFLSNNRKRQCYQCYQHSSRTKSKTQQLLGGILTLSQLKPGQNVTPQNKEARFCDEQSIRSMRMELDLLSTQRWVSKKWDKNSHFKVSQAEGREFTF